MLSIVTQLRNEEKRIKEWIKYHNLIGIENFIIFDDNSEDNSVEILRDLSKSYNIKIFNSLRVGKYIETKNPNIYSSVDLHERIKYSYNQGLNLLKNNFPLENHWCFFIEVDEFLDWKTNISDYLKSISPHINRLHIPSYDFDDNLDLDKNILPQSKYRWSEETKNNSIFFARSKSCYRITPTSNPILCIHHLDYGQCIKTFGGEIVDINGKKPENLEARCIIQNDENIVKINHYRIPANINKFDIFDDSLTKYNL